MLKPGQNWRNLPVDLQKEALGKSYYAGGGKTGFLRRLAWEKPSPTLVTHPAMPATDLAHPEEDRPLSIEEYRRLQEFPNSWKFAGPLVQQYKQVGNAVPHSLGKSLGQHLIKYLNGEKIGHLGRDTNPNDYWLAPRYYSIPKGLLKPGYNEIKILVHDLRGGGGICLSPVQILWMSPEKIAREKQKEIPYEATIIALADSYDALTSDRPYRMAIQFELALRELKKSINKNYTTDVFNAFIRYLKNKKIIRKSLIL